MGVEWGWDGGETWQRRRCRFRQESLPVLSRIIFAVFSLRRKCMLGEARLVVVGLVCRIVQWVLGLGTSQVLLTSAAANQSDARPGHEDSGFNVGPMSLAKGPPLPIYCPSTPLDLQ